MCRHRNEYSNATLRVFTVLRNVHVSAVAETSGKLISIHPKLGVYTEMIGLQKGFHFVYSDRIVAMKIADIGGFHQLSRKLITQFNLYLV